MSRSAPTATPAAHAIMFWLLAGMAFALFAPAVLLPLWEESRVAHAYERGKAREVADLQAVRDRNVVRIRALQEDPLVIERIARRDLNIRPEGEQATQWSSRELAALAVRVPAELAGDSEAAWVPPSWVQRASAWLPDWPYRKLFVEMPNRLLMLLMAGGLLVTAFVLYSPNSGRSPRPRSG